MAYTDELLSEFVAYVTRRNLILTPDECWSFHPRTRCPRRYGQLRTPYGRGRAHRLAWEAWVGPIPEGM